MASRSRQGILFTELPPLSGAFEESPFQLPNIKSDRSNKVMSKFKPYKEKQKPLNELSAESLLDYIEKNLPEDHLCKLVKRVVFSLDTRKIERKYSPRGQNPFHPKLLLGTLFYAYATRDRSSHKIEEKCQRDHAFIYLMQCYTPDHSTICNFRNNNIEQIEEYFVEILRIMNKLGITRVGNLYIDGTKLRANASAKRTKDRQGFEKWLQRVKEQISGILKEAEEIDKAEDLREKAGSVQESLKKKLSDRKYLKNKIEEALKQMREEDGGKVNLTDPNAHHMKSGGSKDIRPGYNCQAAATEEGVIVSAEAVPDANDKEQLKPMIEKSESNTKQRVEEITADCGYGSYENYEYLEQKKIDGYVPDNDFHKFKSGEYDKEDKRYHLSNFKYDPSTDSYICPEGRRLNYWKTRKNKTKSRQWNHKAYRGIQCGDCSKRSLCTKSKARELLIEIREPLLNKMRKKLLTEKGKLKYLKRQYTIEPIFGHLKFNLGYRHFLLRGLKKVNAEFKLMCIGWNLKKMLQLGIKPAMI